MFHCTTLLTPTFYGNAAGGVVLGGATTSISGLGYARNKQGQILISPTSGLPVVNPNQRSLGNRLPDFTLGWINTFRYKNVRLSFFVGF